jgi:hypothetical protein
MCVKKAGRLLKQLNYAAAGLHCFQGIVVACLIPMLDVQNQGAPSWAKGVYKVRKNLYILQQPTQPEPKCGMPRVLRSVANGSLSDTSLCVSLGTDLQMVQTTSENFYTFKDAVAVHRSFVVGYIDVRYLICSFFFLSFVFQALQGWVTLENRGVMNIAKQRAWVAVLRFVEYSVSASVMLLAIAVQVGLTDVYLLCCLFGLVFATNILGLIAEVLCAREDAWVPHCLGWITCLLAYAPLLDAYVASMRCSDLEPPGYVNVIVFLEFALFSCFGFVQTYTLFFRATSDEHPRVLVVLRHYVLAVDADESTGMMGSLDGIEVTYAALSVIAKTLLAWLVLGPTLVNAENIF